MIPGSERSPGEGNGYPPWLFLPGEFHGQRRLGGYSPWGRKESDTTELVTLVWLIHFVVQQKLPQHCKATVLQFKKNESIDIVNLATDALVLFSSIDL